MVSRVVRVGMLVSVVAISGSSRAATYTWTGTTDSLWTTTTNWNPSAAVGGPTSADALVFNGSGSSTVDLENASRTVTNIAYSGMTLPRTITATNGSLTINGGNQSFGVQANGTLVTDYSGLSSFTYTQTGSNSFDVRMTIPAAGASSGTATLNLATQGSGTNLIRAANIGIGAAAGSSGGTAWGGILGLGKANTLNTNSFAIGGFNGSGSSAFQAGVTNGTLLLRGTAGGATRVAVVDVGATSSGTRDGSGTLDLTNGTIDALVTKLTIGRHQAGASNGPTSRMTMPGGTLDATTFILGEKTDTTGTPTISSTFSQLGGLVTSSTMVFGNSLNAVNAATPNFSSVYNLSSGTLRANVITTVPTVALTNGTSNSASVRRIAWSGGTISNYDAGTDLTVSGTSTNAGYTMQVVLGSTTSPQVFSADSGRTITIGSNAVISGAGLLQKQGEGTLRINTAATYTGNTSIALGTVRLGIANALPVATALTINPSAGTATLDLNGFDQTVASLASSGAGAAVIDVAATGTSRLTVGGDNTNTTFAGRLRNSGGATSVLGFTKNGTGTWTLTGSNSALAGGLVFNAGKVTIDPGSGGSFTSTGRFQMLPGSGVTATLEILSGSNSFSTAASSGALADNSATGTAAWNLAGGATTLALATNRFLIGNKGTGTVTVSNNAAFTITGTPDLVIGGDQQFALNNATGVVTVSSGTLSITGSGNLLLGRNATVGGTTTGANGTINLDGGVFATVRPFTMATGSGAGTGTVNFNGGTLRALGSSADLIAVTAANVKNGGAFIDTNSFDVTIAQPLVSAGSGGLTKLSAGTLTLTGSNSYAGTTAVNGGTLKAGTINAFSTGGVTVASGATLDLNSLGVANTITNNGGTVSNAANYAGTQTVNAAATFGALGGTLVVANGGTATFGGALAAATTINAGGKGILNDSGSISAVGLTNDGTFTIDRTGSSSLATIFSGNGTLVKENTGYVSLTGASGFTGATQINAGTLAVAAGGSLAGGVSVATGAVLGGAGTVGAVSGAGLIAPGDSPGILTSDGSLDPTGGIDFAFELTGTAPTWSNAASSVNDVYHIRNATPLTGVLGAGNTVGVYFNAGILQSGDTFLGGIFIDQTQGTLDLASQIGNANFQFFVAGGSDVTYNGVGYSTLANYIVANPAITSIGVDAITVSSADFTDGMVVNGQVMRFIVVPEPGAFALLACGIAVAGASWLRRGRRSRV